MILFKTLIFFLSLLFLSTSVAGFGRILLSKISRNFFQDVFLGFVTISFIITIIHFFFEINLLISFLIFIFGATNFFYKSQFIFSNLIKRENIYHFLIVFLLIPIFLSQKYHEDFGYYHLPYALSFIEEKIIFGFANIDKPYVYNSIWLNLYSIFFLNEKDYNFITLPSFLLFLSFILFSTNNFFQKMKK